MTSFKPEDLELLAAIAKAKLSQSTSPAAASGSPPSSAAPLPPDLLEEAKLRYLIVGSLPRLVPHNPEMITGHDHVAVETCEGLRRIRHGQWTPPRPALDKLDRHEQIRRLRLWYRLRYWTGKSGPEILIMILNNETADCTWEDDDDKAPTMPPEDHADNALYPLGDDRIGESERQHFAKLAEPLDVDISAFFRADNDLGDGNDPVTARKELTAQIEALLEAKPAPTELLEIPSSELLRAASDIAKGVAPSNSSSPPAASQQKTIGH